MEHELAIGIKRLLFNRDEKRGQLAPNRLHEDSKG